MREQTGHVAGVGGSVSMLSCGTNESAEALMWTDWPQSVQDEGMAGGEEDSDSVDRRTRTGLVLQRQGRRASSGPIGQGERGEDGRSGTS